MPQLARFDRTERQTELDFQSETPVLPWLWWSTNREVGSDRRRPLLHRGWFQNRPLQRTQAATEESATAHRVSLLGSQRTIPLQRRTSKNPWLLPFQARLGLSVRRRAEASKKWLVFNKTR